MSSPDLPGADLVSKGMADLQAGCESIESLLVAIGAPRLRQLGGATAVLHGWRASTIDVDIKVVPDLDAIFRALPRLKERLDLNIELAAPSERFHSCAGRLGGAQPVHHARGARHPGGSPAPPPRG